MSEYGILIFGIDKIILKTLMEDARTPILAISKMAGMEPLGPNVVGTGFFALLFLVLSLRLDFLTMRSVGVFLLSWAS